MPRAEPRDRMDPFAEGAGPFVAVGPHARAVEAIAAALASGERLICLDGAPGAGKSRVLEAAARAWREPGRRVAMVDAGTGLNLADGLARALGGGPGARLPDGSGWARLAELARLARVQRQRLLLVVDGAERVATPGDLDRLGCIDARGGSPVALLLAARDGDGPGFAALDDRATALRLLPLTRGEAAAYLAAKLSSGGREAGAIAPGAVSRLHAAARGRPRALDRLARRALAAAGGGVVAAADVDAMLAADEAAGRAA
jgi:type II secretory pathway predicted ATPase ExeA